MSRHGTDETSRDDSVHNVNNVQQKYTRFLPETSVVNNPNRSSLRTKMMRNGDVVKVFFYLSLQQIDLF